MDTAASTMSAPWCCSPSQRSSALPPSDHAGHVERTGMAGTQPADDPVEFFGVAGVVESATRCAPRAPRNADPRRPAARRDDAISNGCPTTLPGRDAGRRARRAWHVDEVDVDEILGRMVFQRSRR
ncbi:hypothetical protein [Massilia phosphatilytica]